MIRRCSLGGEGTVSQTLYTAVLRFLIVRMKLRNCRYLPATGAYTTGLIRQATLVPTTPRPRIHFNFINRSITKPLKQAHVFSEYAHHITTKTLATTALKYTVTMSTQCDSMPFRLMDLPAELRLMAYKRLPRQIKHTELRYVGVLSHHPNTKVVSTVILITRHIPVAILRTSRQVYAEAHDIVAALIRNFVTESQSRVIGHDMRLDALQELLQSVMTERVAFSVSWFLHLHVSLSSELTQW